MPEASKKTPVAKKKRGLGRGIGSLIQDGGGKETNESSHSPKIEDHQRIWMVGIDKIQPNKSQPRKNFESQALKELAESVKTHGVIQPLLVQKNSDNKTFSITAGERRWRAAQMAGLHEVPVIVQNHKEQKNMELALIENIQREDLNPIEEAEAYNYLMTNHSLTQLELSKRLGKERATIANSLRLLGLPQEVKRSLVEGLISMGHAKVLLTLEKDSEKNFFAREVITKKWSVRALEKEIQKWEMKKKAQHESQENQEDEKLERIKGDLVNSVAKDLQKSYNTKVSVDYREGKGKISLYYYDDDQFNHMVEMLRQGCKI